MGHRLIGSLADARLTPRARIEVARLLQSNGRQSLAEVANWADTLRENNPGLGRKTARWHFANLAEGNCVYVEKRDCPNGDCVVEAIRRQRALLGDRAQPDAVRVQALKLLVHFVGDIHQPLHAGYARDHGGNDVQVNINGKGSNLHKLWDGELLRSAHMDERRYLAHLQQLRLPSDAQKHTGAHAAWAEASCRIVLRNGFYPAKPRVEPTYFNQWRPVADARLRLAGHRLAQLINESLD